MLCEAVLAEDPEVLQLLLDSGWDTKAYTTGHHPRTALHEACFHGELFTDNTCTQAALDHVGGPTRICACRVVLIRPHRCGIPPHREGCRPVPLHRQGRVATPDGGRRRHRGAGGRVPVHRAGQCVCGCSGPGSLSPSLSNPLADDLAALTCSRTVLYRQLARPRCISPRGMRAGRTCSGCSCSRGAGTPLG